MDRDRLLPTDDESMTTRTLGLFWRHRVLASIVFAAVFTSAVCFARYLPDLFRASAILLVERPVPEAYVRPAVSGELESRLHVIKQEILSRTRLTELVERFNLYPELRQREALDSVLDQMRHDIAIETTGPEQVSGRKTTVSFKLSYTGSSGETVSDVTNELADFYVAQNAHIRSQEATRLTEFLKAQLDATRRQLDRHEDSMRAYTSAHPGELPQQVEVNLAALERLNTQLRLNGERQMRVLDDREKLADALLEPATDVDERPRTNLPVSERIERMKRDLQLMESQGMTGRHPDVIRLKTELAAVERERQDAMVRDREAGERAAESAAATMPLRRRTIDSLNSELEKLKADEAALRENILVTERRLEGVPARAQEFGRITRDYTATKDLYDSLVKRFDDAQLAESLEADDQGERFRILEAAIPPSGPIAPNRTSLLIMGLLFAVAAAALTALAAEQFDSSFHSTDDIRRFTRVPVLATITEIKPGLLRRAAGLLLTTASLAAVIAIVVMVTTYLARDNARLVSMLTRGGA